jgi:mannose-6-phosphate isomerase-like protein (cupin superfamily)
MPSVHDAPESRARKCLDGRGTLHWAAYVHDVDELVLVVEGDVEFEIEGKVHRPPPGEELFSPARARHTVRNVGRGELRWLDGYRW